MARGLGGSHDLENMILICDSCHAALHRGLINISGTSANLVVTRRHEVAFEVEPTIVEHLDEDAHPSKNAAHTKVVSSYSEDSIDETVDHQRSNASAAPLATVSSQPADQNEETVDRHSSNARVGTSANPIAKVSSHSADQIEETVDRQRPNARVGTSAAPLASRSTDQIDKAVDLQCSNPCVASVSSQTADQSATVDRHPPSADVARRSAQLSKFDRERLRADARSALVTLGFRPGEAGKAVDAAMRVDELTLDELLREALRFLRPPMSS